MTLMNSLFKNRNYLYFIAAIAFFNVVGFASVQRNDMVILYCLLGVILYRFTKNVSLLLTIAVVLVNSMAVLHPNNLLNEYYQNKEALQAYNKVEYNCIKDMNYINNKNTKNTENRKRNRNRNGSENTEDDDTNSSTELINKIKKQLEKAQRKEEKNKEKEKKEKKERKALKEKKEKIANEIKDKRNQLKDSEDEEANINMRLMKDTFM